MPMFLEKQQQFIKPLFWVANKTQIVYCKLQISQATTETVKAEPREKRSSVIFNIFKS